MKRSIHNRAVRGYAEYQQWTIIAEFLDTKPSPAEILLWLDVATKSSATDRERRRSKNALEVLILDRYPGVKVMEKLKGEEQ